MKLYLSGPMSGIKDFNYPLFRNAAEDLRSRITEADRHEDRYLYEVVSPVELDEATGFDPATYDGGDGDLNAEQYANFLSRDIHVIATQGIDAVVVLPNWERSGGARTEVAFAQALGLPILEYPTLEPVNTAGRDQGEVRIVNDATGGEKGRKDARMDLLPWTELEQVAKLYAAGAAKYADHNWRRGYAWSLSFAAMMRHAGEFWEGEDLDAETGQPHLASVVFHALALLYFAANYPELDDRPRTLLTAAQEVYSGA